MKNKLAILGGEPIRKENFIQWPIHNEREIELINKVVKSGNWSFDGPFELEFAKKFANYHDAKYGECVMNGSIALELSLKAAGVKPKDEVIVPALTWVATASSVINIGAVPVFLDVDKDSYCINPNLIEDEITKKTKAIIPVHIYCSVCDMEKIHQIASRDNLHVVEDCAHIVGTKYNCNGSYHKSDAKCFSFQQTKAMTSGEGGIVITSDESFAERVYSYKNCGRIRKIPSKVLGHNYRMTEFQAAILLAQLDRLENQSNVRDINAKYLSNELKKLSGIKPLNRNPNVDVQGYYSFVFRYDKNEFFGLPTDVFKQALNKEGIPTYDMYHAVYQDSLWNLDFKLFPHLKGKYNNVHCPVSENAYRETVLIGHNALLGTREDMDDIVKAIKKIKEFCYELIV